MRALLLAAFLCFAAASNAQYYYKDIVGTRESAELVKTYRQNKVNRVVLTSYDGNNTKSEDFYVEQQFSPVNQTLTTLTRSDMGSESVLVSRTDASDHVVMTLDSSNIMISHTSYDYDGTGNLVLVTSTSTDTAHSSTETEQHLWQWSNGHPTRMLRIKNGRDTTFVQFKTDEQGNVSEEQEIRKGVRNEPVYYYYNDQHQLTDIVRYNNRVKKLLPEYMFEYSASNQVIQKITVPDNSFSYLIWRYQYNEQGLKTREAIYSKEDKRKQLGRIEYQYFFGS